MYSTNCVPIFGFGIEIIWKSWSKNTILPSYLEPYHIDDIDHSGDVTCDSSGMFSTNLPMTMDSLRHRLRPVWALLLET